MSWTMSEQLEAAFHEALVSGDANAVERALFAVAKVDPPLARQLYDDLKTTLTLVSEAKSRVCPSCGQPPGMAIGTHQWICENLECRVLIWNPTKTPEENMANVNDIDLPEGFP